MPLPLDIKEEYLFGDVAILHARAADTIDDMGWSTEGGLYGPTFIRGRTMIAHIKGQIGEIALGNSPAVSLDDILYVSKLIECLLDISVMHELTDAG